MTKPFTGRKRIRKDFGRIGEITRMPNLIEVQKSSYDQFLQIGVPAEKRESIGLQEVFRSRLRERVLNYDERLAQMREHGIAGPQGLQFGPHHILRHPFPTDERAEAAVRAGNDAQRVQES